MTMKHVEIEVPEEIWKDFLTLVCGRRKPSNVINAMIVERIQWAHLEKGEKT
jgi:hypothetical protein